MGVKDFLSIYHVFVIFFGELTATAFLLFFGCLGCHSHNLTDTQIALAWGATVSGVVMVFGHLSGAHTNPCITLSALIIGLIHPLVAIVYFVAQMLGAVIGYNVLMLSLSAAETINVTKPGGSFCVPSIDTNITIYQGMLLEFVGTSLLIYGACSAWDPRNAVWADSNALKFGFLIIAIVYGLAPKTGGCLNPARQFAPALYHFNFKDAWVYWVAHLLAGTTTPLIYNYFYLRGFAAMKKIQATPRKELALHSVEEAEIMMQAGMAMKGTRSEMTSST